MEKELVLRSQAGKQHVTYRFDIDRWEPLTEYFKKAERLQEFFLDEKMSLIHRLLSLRFLVLGTRSLSNRFSN